MDKIVHLLQNIIVKHEWTHIYALLHQSVFIVDCDILYNISHFQFELDIVVVWSNAHKELAQRL